MADLMCRAERPGFVALRIGLRSARANVVPMVVLWALAAATVWAYYAVPAVTSAFEPLLRWQTECGWWAAFLNRVFFNGLLPGVFLLAIPSIRPKHVLLVIGAQALWGGCWGVVTDFFFRWLDVLFGSGRDMATLFSKMLADEFGLTLFLLAPADAAFFFWVGREFSFSRTWRERPRRFFLDLVLPNLISNWCVWIPVSLAIFAFPLPLQVQISGFAAAFWTLMCLQIGAQCQPAERMPQMKRFVVPERTRMRVLPFVMVVCAALAACPCAGADAVRPAALKDVRLQGPLARKADTFFARRIVDPDGRDDVFEEARRAFVLRDDDDRPWDGQWRGEFWGKSMISAARVADYLDDAELKGWIREECRRLLATTDADGYLGSYAVVTNCSTPPAVVAARKGGCTNWNLWCRKYTIWGLFMAAAVTGDKAILQASAAQLEHLIDMVKKNGIRLEDTGHYTLNGMPTMSILKPALMIYEATRNGKFLSFAEEIVRGWDRDDGRAPNFFRNARNGRPLHAWYPKPEAWAKTYEMLSCLDGLVEYHRVTGDRRTLETVIAIRDNLAATDGNAIGGLGISDRLLGAENFAYASTEVCDIIHWIRLNVDLYLVTGDDRYLDSVEFSYFNAFLASICRNSGWTPLIVRDAGRHRHSLGQCGYAYNHCCVDNAARTFLDVASVTVARDRNGVFRVNLYQDATAAIDGVRFEIRGDYPAHGRVTVKVTGRTADGKDPKVAFRKPGWCPKMDVSHDGAGLYTLVFDMNPRLAERTVKPSIAPPEEAKATQADGADRYAFVSDTDLLGSLPKSAYATVLWGPLVLARSSRLFASRKELASFPSVNGKGYRLTLKPVAAHGVYAPFEVELSKPGAETIRTKACSYESASDDPAAKNGYIFSIRF